jgi:hypothetical protein
MLSAAIDAHKHVSQAAVLDPETGKQRFEGHWVSWRPQQYPGFRGVAFQDSGGHWCDGVVGQLKFDWCPHPESGVASTPVWKTSMYLTRVGELDGGLPAARVRQLDPHPRTRTLRSSR